jgi:alpha-tubulin suppressor-like RCC1 family protein
MLKTFLQRVDFSQSGWPSSWEISPKINLKPRARLFAVPIDIHLSNDTTIIYPKGFVAELIKIQNKLAIKKQRILHIKVGDTFAMVVSDHGKVFSFGMNDRNQLARRLSNNEFEGSSQVVKNLTSNKPKILSLGGSHGIFLDQNENIYTWGDNSHGQLGLGHNYKNSSMNILNSINKSILTAKARGSRTAIVTEQNQYIYWDSKASNKSSEQFKKKSLLIEMSHLKEFGRNNIYKDDSDMFEIKRKIHSKNQKNRNRLHSLRVRTKSQKKPFRSSRYDVKESFDEQEDLTEESEDLDFYPSNENLHLPSNPFIGKMYRLSEDNVIKSISMGHSFTLLLTQNGKLMSQGDNSMGQCGFSTRETQFIEKPTFIQYFKNKGSFIKQVDCGLQHSIVMTNSGKVLSFGANDNYQLGHSKTRFQGKPAIVRLPDMNHQGLGYRAKNVSATSKGSCILTDDHRIFIMGAFGVGLQKFPRVFPYEITFFNESIKESFVPIKLCTSWSSTVSVTYLIFLDYRGLKINIKNNKDKLSNNFANKWLSTPGQTLFAPFDENLIQYINPKSFMKSKYNLTKNKIEFFDNIVFNDQKKNKSFKESISRSRSRHRNFKVNRSRSTNKSRSLNKRSKSSKRSTYGKSQKSKPYLSNSGKQMKLKNTLMMKNLKFNSKYNIEEGSNGFIRQGQLEIKKKKKLRENMSDMSHQSKMNNKQPISFYDLNENPQIPNTVQSETANLKINTFDSLMKEKEMFLDFLEAPGTKFKANSQRLPRYGKPKIPYKLSEKSSEIREEDIKISLKETDQKYEDPFIKSRKSESRISQNVNRRPSSPFKNLKEREREKSIKKLKKSYSKIIKEREQAVRFLPPKFGSNDSFGEPQNLKNKQSKVSKKKDIKKKDIKTKSINSNKKMKKNMMDQILKQSESNANEIRVSQDHLLSQMQQSNSRFKTSKVINQLKYEEVSSENKALKSSLKKVPRFGKSKDKDTPKVMFRDSVKSNISN